MAFLLDPERRPLPLPLILLATALIGTPPSGAQVPLFPEPELQMRSNFSGAFNLPDSAFFTSSDPSLDELGRVAIKVGVLGSTGSQAIWFGDGDTGGIVFTSPVGAFLSDVSNNGTDRLIFEQTFTSPDGLFFVEPGTATSGLLTDLPLGATNWSSPQANASGEVGYRAGFAGDHAYVSFDGMSASIHATEVGLDAQSPYSFLFTPSFADEGRIAAKVRLGGPGQINEAQPDEIRIFADDGTSVLVAEDQDSNPTSDFLGFNNSLSLTDDGQVAFIAQVAGGVRGVFLHTGDSLDRGTEIIEIARDDSGIVTGIEFFAPVANTLGWVAFRGLDAQGLQAIFVGDGTTLRRVIGEHDLVPTDLGTARIDQNDTSSVFSGSPDLSNTGQLAFVAALTPPDNNQIEWGSGLFLAGGVEIFSNGFENGDTAAWAQTQP